MSSSLQQALYESGAHIVFKTVKEHAKKKKVVAPVFNKPKARKPCKNQRMVGGIPSDPIDLTARLVTLQKPRNQ